jgi:hypothetical protein
MGTTAETAMEYEEMPLRKILTKSKKETRKMSEKKTTKAAAPAAPKQPASIKLSTIWKGLVYFFAVVGVVLSIMYVNDIVNGFIDSRADAKAQQMIKEQPATAAPQSKVNQ